MGNWVVFYVAVELSCSIVGCVGQLSIAYTNYRPCVLIPNLNYQPASKFPLSNERLSFGINTTEMITCSSWHPTQRYKICITNIVIRPQTWCTNKSIFNFRKQQHKHLTKKISTGVTICLDHFGQPGDPLHNLHAASDHTHTLNPVLTRLFYDIIGIWTKIHTA